MYKFNLEHIVLGYIGVGLPLLHDYTYIYVSNKLQTPRIYLIYVWFT